jgi:phage terminase large subunit
VVQEVFVRPFWHQTLKVNVTAPPKLRRALENLRTNRYDTIVLHGGRGSAKSEALALIGLMESYLDDGVILCAREIQKSIDDSLYASLVSKISELGLSADFNVLKTKIQNLRTGSQFMFAGLKSNISNVKSIKRLRVVLVDEAENVSQNSWDVIRPTPRYGNTRLYVVFNPRFESDPTWREFVARRDDNTLIIKINWRDNPWFPASLERQRQRALRGDIGKYNWIWEGDFLKVSDRSVLGRQLKVEHFDIDENFGSPMIGIDWGFSNDPNVIVEVYVKGADLYVRRCGIKTQVPLTGTAAWLVNKVPHVANYPARADCARPETISMVQSTFRTVKACKKWSGSVEDGVSFLQSFDNIIIHPNACTNRDEQDELLAELYGYSYKVLFKDTPQEEVTAVIEDKSNNVSDAIRYAIEPLLKKQGGFSFA